MMDLNWTRLMTAAALMGAGDGDAGQRSGPSAGRLKSCPDSPNCVSSQSSDPRHRVAPITFAGAAHDARLKLLSIIRSMPRTRVLANEGPYLRIEFTSALFRFVDDVEFYIEETRKLIHVRSASRVGYWDLGANRRRVEEVRRRMATHTTEEIAI